MAALHRAVALEEVDEVAVLVAEELHLDVAGPGDVLLEEHVGDAEGRAGLAAGLVEGLVELVGGGGDAHAPAAAAHGRLDDDRDSRACWPGPGPRRCRGPALSLPGRTGTPACLGDAPGHDLVAELFEDLGARADEDEAGLPAGPGECRVLGQEAVAGMDGIDLVLAGQGDDAVDVEIGADRLARLADAVGLVRLEAVQGEAVFVGVDGDRADAQLVGGAEDADGDLAAVGDQQLAEGAAR